MEGGLDDLGQGLLKMFASRVGTSMMHKLGMAKDQRYTGKEARECEAELDDSHDCTAALLRKYTGDTSDFLDERWDAPRISAPVNYGPPVPWQNLYAKCMAAAKEMLPDFLTQLCINPDLDFYVPGQPEGDKWDSRIAKVSYFQDITGALFEYKRRYEEQVKGEFCQTAIARQIWEQLDYALRTKTMVTIEGREGRGKTETALAWCNCHLGVARFVSLIGTNTKTSHFTEFAKAFGVGHGNTYKVSEMQASI
jgi:hypothetical protein